ncbi:MAG: bifunctional DNA-formamidopyrimidine glycosylase/DNA-(apurinic or apyrimidinic site) lyase [Gammaproteobacteria bacterium]|nr:bifunctional DNA-formamidopyrimidine glycosylase/DNA-(apurinic or apyrimidinic site) lyase [Gammaproteobacteria bacterium]
MPELPEVETTRRGIESHLLGRCVEAVVIRNPNLRWKVPDTLARELPGQTVHAVERRAKYLLLYADRGTVIVHLGMSGSLRVVACSEPAERYDHVDLVLTGGTCLRLRDPRRFGSVLWTRSAPADHALLKNIGPEPLAAAFDGAYLHTCTRRRTVAIRDLLLNTRIVAGIGNIYANEALFQARIRPARRAGRLSRADCDRLVGAIRATLAQAIEAGGTTLRDFQNADGNPGYFQQVLSVYGRAGEPCRQCGTPVRALRIGQRRAFFCPRCQH